MAAPVVFVVLTRSRFENRYDVLTYFYISRHTYLHADWQVLSNDNVRVRRNLERIRQVEVGDTKTVRAITSSALRGKLRLSGRDKRGRVFLPE